MRGKPNCIPEATFSHAPQIRDATVSTAHDVPLMLQNSDFDVPPLTADDFCEKPGLSTASQTRPYSKEEISFYIHQARLAESMGAVHTRHWRQNRVDPARVGSIESREIAIASAAVGVPPLVPTWTAADDFSVTAASWYSSLPTELQYNVDDIQGHRFWPAYLHMLFLYDALLFSLLSKIVLTWSQHNSVYQSSPQVRHQGNQC